MRLLGRSILEWYLEQPFLDGIPCNNKHSFNFINLLMDIIERQVAKPRKADLAAFDKSNVIKN